MTNDEISTSTKAAVACWVGMPMLAVIHFYVVIPPLLHYGDTGWALGFMLAFFGFAGYGLRWIRKNRNVNRSWNWFRYGLKVAIVINVLLHLSGWLQLMFYAWQPSDGLASSIPKSILLMMVVAAPAFYLNIELKRTVEYAVTELQN